MHIHNIITVNVGLIVWGATPHPPSRRPTIPIPSLDPLVRPLTRLILKLGLSGVKGLSKIQLCMTNLLLKRAAWWRVVSVNLCGVAKVREK